MFYTRGSSSDYDRWATVTGDDGWSWKNLLPYILKVCFIFLLTFIFLNDETPERTLDLSIRPPKHLWTIQSHSPRSPWQNLCQFIQRAGGVGRESNGSG
jgi:choline dehydrogenase-like flavoprotein